MYGRTLRKRAARLSPHPVVAEPLEPRQMLSAAGTLKPNIVYAAAVGTGASSVQGFTPAEIRKAYNFDSISGTGAGQTIAIVDAFNDPNIAADLAVFDNKFGLAAPPSLTVVGETGGSTLPATDAGWAGEISLDVEWAHAIAPGANILLVEAAAADTAHLMAAVDTARNAAGVSVVAMSWGGSEFFSWRGGGESSSQLNYDPIFTTPAGHQGVTFIASAGDSGSYSGVQWPASSPNVLSVGGTTLTTDAAGNYVNEQSWSGTNGGYSVVENQPTYQNAAQNSGARSVPDVAYNADPNTGLAIYDSLPYQGSSGWQEVGGTSAGAPQWAALIALADQARASAGKGTLDGATQTLPMLYDLYSTDGTTVASTYASTFNDIVDAGPSNPWQWGWGSGNNTNPATAGYDAITGLGSPHASAVLNAIAGSSSGTSAGNGASGSTGSTNTGGTTTTPQSLPDSPITGVIETQLPASAVAGQLGSIRIDLTNTGSTRFNGPLTISLYALAGTTIGSADTPIATVTLKKLKLNGGASKHATVRFTYPGVTATGSYNLVASFSTGATTNATQTVSTSRVTVAPATVDLATAFTGASALTVTPGKAGYATVTITNLGDVTAAGKIFVSLYAAAGQIVDAAALHISKTIVRTIHLRAGQSAKFRVRFTAPLGRTPGSYNVIASEGSTTTVADTNTSNDAAAIGTV